MVKYIIASCVCLIGFALPIGEPTDNSLPEPVYPDTYGYIETTTTTMPRPVVLLTPCEKVRELARIIGWPKKELDTLVKVVYRESRCIPTAHNTTRNKDGSQDYGLMQINDWSWCKPTRYYPVGYLQQVGVIDNCKDLFNPILNLSAGLYLYNYSNGWDQWEP